MLASSTGAARSYRWRDERRARDQLTLQEVDFIEFADLDHGACNEPEASITQSFQRRGLGLPTGWDRDGDRSTTATVTAKI